MSVAGPPGMSEGTCATWHAGGLHAHVCMKHESRNQLYLTHFWADSSVFWCKMMLVWKCAESSCGLADFYVWVCCTSGKPELCSSHTAPAATVPGVTACGSGTLPWNTCGARILECPGLQETVEYWQRYGVACTSVCEAKTIGMHACPRLRFE